MKFCHFVAPATIRIATSIFVLAVVHLFGQTANEGNTPPAKADSFQKSKDCLSQATSVMAEWKRTRFATVAVEWNNHYSPKYDRCLISVSDATENGNDSPRWIHTSLYDAFEHSGGQQLASWPLANTCEAEAVGHPPCMEAMIAALHNQTLDEWSRKLNGKSFAAASATEKETVRAAVDQSEKGWASTATALPTAFCAIDGKAVDCPTAASFISEHMRN